MLRNYRAGKTTEAEHCSQKVNGSMIVDPDFLDHWKTRLLVGSLGGDESAPLYVLRLWAHCQNRRQSEFDNVSTEALKALCHFPGQANQLESSLVASGFVRRDGKTLIICGWSDYNSSLLAAWKNGQKGGRPPTHTQEKPTGLPTDNPGGIRVEKRREEKIQEHPQTPSKLPGRSAASAASCACFEVWWQTYPKVRRCNKATALKRYTVAGKALTARGMKRDEAVAYLQNRVTEFAVSPLGQSRFCPAADVWLNKGRYDDAPESWQRGEDEPAGNGQTGSSRELPFLDEESP